MKHNTYRKGHKCNYLAQLITTCEDNYVTTTHINNYNTSLPLLSLYSYSFPKVIITLVSKTKNEVCQWLTFV